MSHGEPFDAAFSTALLDFNKQAGGYCDGISDVSAREYAVSFTRALQSRARGTEADRFRIPYGLFGPTRGLIETTLTRMFNKHFPDGGSK
jgi:hypothetical protein